ncbi:MAG TPA: PAS domain-containing protein, partial [Sphingomicrobium sp.]
MELSKFGAAESMSGAASHQLSVELGAALAGDTLAAGGALLNALPVPVYATDASGLLTFFNSAFEKFWGSTPTCGRPVFDQWRMNRPGECEMAPFDWPTSVVLRTGAAVQAVVCEGLREDGSSIVFTSSPAPILDADGQVTGTIDVLIDLSAQRAAERELRESEDHYRSAVELSPQMPWTADPDGTILQFNERWCRFTGQSREGALKNAWHTVTNPDDIPDVHRAMGRALQTGEPFDARFRVKTHDGSERWVRARAAARRDEVGSIVRWYGSTEDIHDSVIAEQGLVLAEERYRYAGLATQDVFWDHDFVADTIFWSDGLQTTFGYPLTDNLTEAQFWLDRVHPADRDRVASSMADAVAAGHARWTAEYRFKQGDGSYAHVLDRGALLRSESGAVVR